MSRSVWVVGLLAVTAMACNLPSEQALTATPIEAEIPEGNVTQAGPQTTATLGELPDIAGTVGASTTATQDPDQEATISGGISYPSEGHPAIQVYALRTDGQYYEYIDVEENAGSYLIQVPPGEYYILADAEFFDTPEFDGAYTVYAKCVTENGPDSCPDVDYTLIAILAQPGQTIENINLADWLAPSGTYPVVPGR